MADKGFYPVQFPSGGMSDDDTGGQTVQKPALESTPNYDNANSDGDQTPPSGDGVSQFGNGPAVIQSKGPTTDKNCAPGKGAGVEDY